MQTEIIKNCALDNCKRPFVASKISQKFCCKSCYVANKRKIGAAQSQPKRAMVLDRTYIEAKTVERQIITDGFSYYQNAIEYLKNCKSCGQNFKTYTITKTFCKKSCAKNFSTQNQKANGTIIYQAE